MEIVICAKLMIFHSFFIVTLSSAIKLNEGAELNTKTNKLLNVSSMTATEANNMWQPVIQSHYWLPTSTAFAPATSSVTKSRSRSSHSKNNRPKKVREKYKFTLNNITQNYDKQFAKPLKSPTKLATQPLQQTPVASYMKLEPHRVGVQNNKNAKESEQQQFKPYHLPLLSINYNIAETQYPQMHTSENIMQSEQMYPKLPPLPQQSASSQMLSGFSNFNYSRNMTKHKELTKPVLQSLSVTQNVAEANYKAAPQTDNKIPSKAANFPIQITSNAYQNNLENNLPIALNSVLTNDNIIDNIRNPLQQNHLLNAESNVDVKPSGVGHNEAVNRAKTATTEKIINDSKENILKKLLNNSKEIDNPLKYEINGNNGDGKHEDSDVPFNEDAASDGTAMADLTAATQQVVEATSTTLSAAIAASLKNLESFAMQNVVSLASTATTAILSFLAKANATVNVTDSAELIPQTANLSGQYEISSTAAALATIPTIPLPAVPILKSSTAAIVGSGRKLKKKVKKKFQQILLPLLLAYKLKFLALIPLLAGGLILLVGSTGLAGFFFALFTAVMSLQAGHGDAIVVKKY